MSRPHFARTARFIAALSLAGLLSACSSSGEETGSDMPPSRPVTKQYKPPPRATSEPTLGRVVDESRRRREVIRQLESIFQSPNP